MQEYKTYMELAIERLEDFFYTGKEGDLYKAFISEMEKPLIENVLKKTRGNQSETARILGLNRNTLHKKIKSLNIKVTKFKDT